MQKKPVSKLTQADKKPPVATQQKKVVLKQPPGAVPKDWSELEKNVLICPGNFSQAHKRYKGHNQQSAAVCIVTCAVAELVPMNSWTSSLLDQILDIGTRLYLKSRQISNNRCLEHLKPLDVYKYFFLDDIKVSIRINIEIFNARVPKDSTILQKVDAFLSRFFASYRFGVFECQHTYFAVWKFDRYFYIFDPTEHDTNGGRWTKLPGLGHCYCIRSTTTKTIADVLLKNCPLKQINRFKIYPCNVEKTIKINTVPPETLEDIKPLSAEVVPPPAKTTKPSPPPPEPVPQAPGSLPPSAQPSKEIKTKKSVSRLLVPVERPKLKSVTNFVEVQTGKGILRASTHQRDPKFTKNQGAQSFSNAIAALTMLRQHKSKQWIKNVVDDVLKLGERIHHDAKTLGKECPKKVTLNGVDYTPKIEKYGVIGLLESNNDKILSLEQAIRNSLIDTDCCVIIGPNIVAVWREDNKFYMFDPEERDVSGKLVQPGQSGVACVTWYTKPGDLAATYLSNVPKNSKRNRFILCKVTIKDYEPVAEDWNNFKALTFNKWILRGTFSQQDRRFSPESRNSQCTANATMSLVYKELKEEKDWSSDTVDQMLMSGDEFYRGCVQTLQECGKFKHKYLMVDELKRHFDIDNKRATLEIDDCLVNGIVNAKSDTGIPNLRKGFEQFFTDSDAGVVTANLQSMAIWRRNGTYYYYDSHSRSDQGVLCGYGTACVLRMVTIDDLTNAITINFGADPQNFYNISRVIVRLIDLTEDGLVKPPLNFYEALSDLVAILRSSTSQNDKKFDINAGRQTVPMCLAAVAFNTITSSFDWSQQDLDQVLIYGDDLYIDSMAANYSEDTPDLLNVDEVSTNNVKKQLRIGSNLIDLEFEEVSSGTMTSLQEAVDILNQKVADEGNSAFQSILESEYLTVTMWRDDNLFYLFDPKPRDEKGQVYGKDDWSVKIEEEEELGVEEEEDEEGEGQETVVDEEGEEEDRDEMAGGDNMGEPEEDEDFDEEDEGVEVPPPVEKKGSAFWRQKEEEGKACVLRFSRVDDLIQHIVDNSPPTKRDAIEFSLKSVKVKNTPLLHEVYDPEQEVKKDDVVGDWNDFKEVDYGKWILQSSKNFQDELFPAGNRGRQAIPMCIVALSFAHLYTLSKFSQNVLDDILAYGDRLLTVVRKLRTKELKSNKELELGEDEIEQILNDTKFDIADYPRKLTMGEKTSRWDVNLEAVIGDLRSKDEQVHDLTRGLVAFFQGNRFGIIQCRDYPVAIWQDEVFYMFDPHPSGPSGVKSPIGVSCITRFKQIDDLAQVYTANLPKMGTNMFDIHAFTFAKEKSVRKHPLEEVPPKEAKVGGFNAITKGKSIVRGDTRHDCTKFDRGVHIHSAPIAFVALAVSLNKDPDTWTRLVVNEILAVGEDLYNESLDKLGDRFDPWSDRLDIYRVNPDFKLGSLKVNCALRYTAQKGIVDVKNSTTLNLRKGLDKFFEENSHGIIVVDKFVLPIWEHVKDGDVSVYMFDPNSRGPTGLPGQGGVACAMKFYNAKLAADHVMSCMMDIDKTKTEFAVVPVEIVVGAAKSKRKVRRVSPGAQPCGMASTRMSTLKKTALSKTPVTVLMSSKTKPLSHLTTHATCPGRTTLLEQKRFARAIAEEERAIKEARRCAALGRDEMYEINSNQAIVRGMRAIAPDRELPVNIVAFVFMKIAKDLNKWTYKQIELILEAGYQLYVDSFNAYKPETSKLTLQHVLRRVLLKDCEVKIEIKKPILGAAFTRNNLYTHLSNFFTVTNFFILCYSDVLVSIYFKGGYYYLFDPYSRDLNGNKSHDGCAMMMRFGDLADLVDKVVRNLRSPEDDPQKRYGLIVVGITGVVRLT